MAEINENTGLIPAKNIASKNSNKVKPQDIWHLKVFCETYKQYQFCQYIILYFLEQNTVSSNTVIHTHFDCGCYIKSKAKKILTGPDFSFYKHIFQNDYYYVKTKQASVNIARTRLPYEKIIYQ